MIIKQLEDVIDFARNGASIKQSDGQGGYPITRIETIWNKTIDQDRFGFADISDDELVNYEKYLLESGDILMTHINSPKHLGKCAMYEGTPSKLIHGMNLLCIRARTDESYPKYLKYYLNSKDFKNQLPKISNQSVNQASFSASKLKKLKIPLPPLDQQKKIAAILDAADAYRQKTKALIEKYDELTQSLFLEMFGDPVTNPKGWEVKSLGSVLSIKHGFAFKSEYFAKKGEHKLLTPGNFFEKGGYRELGEKQKFYVGSIPEEYVLSKGDILTAMTEQAAGLLGSVLIVPESSKYLHNQRLGLLELKTRLIPEYIYTVFNQPSIRKRIHVDATGTKVRHTSPKKIMKIEVGIPPIKLQEQFVNSLKEINEQKFNLKVTEGKAEDLFNSLLQRAFKGELV
jgi:type I restriction enzyme S subunit